MYTFYNTVNTVSGLAPLKTNYIFDLLTTPSSTFVLRLFFHKLTNNNDETFKSERRGRVPRRSSHNSFPSVGRPATHTKLIQYRLPFPSGRLWPRCVPSILTVSPFGSTLTLSQFVSWSLKLGHPWFRLSFRNSSIVLPRGAVCNWEEECIH